MLHLDEETRELVDVIGALFLWKVTACTDTRDGAVSVLHGRMVNSVRQIRDKRLREIFFKFCSIMHKGALSGPASMLMS